MPYDFMNPNGMDTYDPNDPTNVVGKYGLNQARRPWNLGNSGGGALGPPGSALGRMGSALNIPGGFGPMSAIGSALAPAAQAISPAGQAASAIGGAASGAAGAGSLLSKLGGGPGIGQAVIASGLPQMIFGKKTGGTLGNIGSGIMTGMPGGPWGMAAGGAAGLLSSMLSGKGGGQRQGPPMPVSQASGNPMDYYGG